MWLCYCAALIAESRGKKIFRKFHDGPPSNASDWELEHSGDELLHQAGPAGHRPLTRASIKPRLLFQEEIRQRDRENGDDDDEEAITDIEVPIATPSRKTRKGAAHQEATPPPTTRVKRRKFRPTTSRRSDLDRSTEISFDSWSRVKSSTRGADATRSGMKRSGPALESPADKRARSEHSSAMSLDSF